MKTSHAAVSPALRPSSLNPPAFARVNLTKPRFASLIVVTVLLALRGPEPLQLTLLAAIAVAMAVCSAAALTHVTDWRVDALPARLPTDRLHSSDWYSPMRWPRFS